MVLAPSIVFPTLILFPPELFGVNPLFGLNKAFGTIGIRSFELCERRWVDPVDLNRTIAAPDFARITFSPLGQGETRMIIL